MAKRAGESSRCHGEREREREEPAYWASLLQRYIGILIDEIKGQGMLVPLAPFIPSRDPPIWRYETEYMPVPPGSIDGWGFDPISD